MRLIAVLALYVVFGGLAWGIEVAITVDDLPAAGDEVPGVSRAEIARQMIETLTSHRVPGVYGFVNGSLAKHMPERLQILQAWREAGFLVGNHTFSHSDLAGITAKAFMDEIETNEPLLSDVASSIREFKVFRYPFLSEGETNEKRYAIRSYLQQRKYVVAQVSIDFDDWRWNTPYIRCRERPGRDQDLAELERSYLTHALAHLNYSEELKKRIFGENKELNHVLLLHINGFTVRMLGKLLSTYEKAGVRWIPMEKALTDKTYAQDSNYTSRIGKPFLVQLWEGWKLKLDGVNKPPTLATAFDTLCR